MLADDGTLVAELWDDERRYPIGFDEIPLVVRDAFLAAEDANFYRHPGIDFVSILRALWKNLLNQKTMQGASTITQQVVKSLLLSRERTYERKAKEAILSYRLEKALSKDDILSIYLNEIFLGQTAYGVKAAARVHFKKEPEKLSLAEAAYLAGLPQRPSYYTDPSNRAQAIERQHYVLSQMLRNNMITPARYAQAKNEELTIYPAERGHYYAAPYFVTHAEKVLEQKLQEIDANISPIRPGGYEVRTTLNLEAYNSAERALRRALREVDKRRGWRGPKKAVAAAERSDFLEAQLDIVRAGLRPHTFYEAVVTDLNPAQKSASVRVGPFRGTVNFKRAEWARRFLTTDERALVIDPFSKIKLDDVIEVSLSLGEDEIGNLPIIDIESNVDFQLDQTPDIQGAFAVANALTGEVKAIIGGYDYEVSVFNRATQALLQPGSAFKPIIYLAAVEKLKYTPATIVPDSPISMPDGTGNVWSPQNYDRKYLGPITLRTALQKSRNVVSVHLLRKTGVDTAIDYARKLGITTKIDRNMSIALGTPEVHLIELVRAYGAFAAGGWLSESLIIKQVRDRDGKLIYEQHPKQKQVIDENSAFIMANMMKGVVERGTATSVKVLGRPVAGKTGTTNEQMDAWFVGYTPEWVAGGWVGFDVKKTIGRFETGGKAAAPIFLYFMQEFLKGEPELDFEIPDGVIPVAVNPNSGRLVDADTPGAFLEYFVSGTEPSHSSQDLALPKDYLSNDEF